MKELTVYYCSKCGYYGYYCLSKHAVCPKCDIGMTPLPMGCQEFMNLDCKERDDLLANRIITSSSPYIARLTAPHKANNNRELIARLSARIYDLEEENKKLTETVAWMHETIWDLVRKSKGLDDPE